MAATTTLTLSFPEADIALLTLDDPESSANTMNEAYLTGMADVLDELTAARSELRGVLVTSAKKTFFAGGDLEVIIGYGPDDVVCLVSVGGSGARPVGFLPVAAALASRAASFA